MTDQAPHLSAEQDRLNSVYQRLDEMRQTTRDRLASVRRAGPSGSPQNRSERDSFATLYEDRIALLDAVEDRLVFGRLDFDKDPTRYIGRIGLSDHDHVSLLTDWRAPAAQPFYRATAAQRDGVKRRRHLITQARTITGVEDEILDLNLSKDDIEDLHLSGEGALLAAMSAGRTGRMNDIVATIQTEQDEIIRSDVHGALVVQGGPGTGKTAVALHRAAYLLYAHRKLLERSGVLLVGPSTSFIRYIDQVLPSLGETGVVSTTIGSLVPGHTTNARDTPAVEKLKGDRRFATFIKRAVKARERVPQHDTHVRIDGHDLVIRRRDIKDAMFKARRTNKPHNIARATFVKEMLHRLAEQYVADMPYEIAPEDRGEIIEEIRTHRDVKIALNIAWFPISAPKLIDDLFAKPHRLEQVASELSPADRALLHRPANAPLTTADIPLLDEALELLGEDNHMARQESRAQEAARAEALEYARQVLENSGGNWFVDADTLAQRFADSGPTLTTAERAIKDRTWTFAHVIVDEAQELSHMAWRMLIRRCPTRSFTIVGDVAQTSSLAGTTSWERMLTPLFKELWRIRELTINYRTPAEIAQAALTFARAQGLRVSELTSARDIDGALTFLPVSPATLIPQITTHLDDFVERYISQDVGRIAIVMPPEVHAEIAPLLATHRPELVSGNDPLVTLATPVDVKGLEYDGVILVDPVRMLEAPCGASDVFVTMTRATKQLLVVHYGQLPTGLTAPNKHDG
ncbi:HelD family protein [Timonella sp. A28]|uniref:HelD family protein n=1 Tax=Timonella sp. A28 TaxID=3442640 RepID=UPI003EB9C77A